MQETPKPRSLPRVLELPRQLRGKRAFSEKDASQPQESEASERSAMGEKVIEMKLPLTSCEMMYLTGRTLLTIAQIRDEVLFDVTGTPILSEEFYEVTARGIRRVA